MARWFVLLPAVLGITSWLPGCATREFVRKELARSTDTLEATVDRLGRDLQKHRTAARELVTQAEEVDRRREETTRAAIEALGVADVAAGRAADAVDHATLALARANEAGTVADQALTQAEETAQRLTRLWRGRAKLSIVEAVVLRFGVDAWALDDRARAAVLEIARRLRENPTLIVELEGYTDSAGATPYNVRLSQLRAEAVGRFLAELGVETHRLQTIGLGTARPVADNGTVEGRRQNRRVVLRLLDPS
jgi:outer membrane protein OmpA-like peptidoglycan-associated protein